MSDKCLHSLPSTAGTVCSQSIQFRTHGHLLIGHRPPPNSCRFMYWEHPYIHLLGSCQGLVSEGFVCRHTCTTHLMCFFRAVAELKAEAASIETNAELDCQTRAREAEIQFLKEQNELETSKARELGKIEVSE